MADRPASSQTRQGIAGRIVYQSDMYGLFGPECRRSKTSLQITSMMRSNEGTPGIVSRPAAFVVAEGSYERALDPGAYQVCNAPEGGCVVVTVEADKITTVNVVRTFKSPTLHVFPPAPARSRWRLWW